MTPLLSDSEFEKAEDDRIARLLLILIFISWGVYFFVIVSALIFPDRELIAITLIGAALFAIPFVMVKKGKLRFSSFLFVLSALGTVTYIATIGQGIHDLALISMPIVLIFAGLAQDRLYFRICVGLMLLSISWLAVGEYAGLYTTKPFVGVTAHWITFGMVSILILVAAIAIDLLAQNMRNSILQAKTEIAHRKQTEKILKEKEVQYRNIADSGIALIWTSGTDKLCNYFNLPWLRFTGRTLEQEMGNGWTEGVHPDDFDHCLQVYVTSFEKREKFNMEYRLRHVSGEFRWLQDMGTPNYDSNGEFFGYIGHCFDITERKILEEQLKHQSTHDTLTGLYNRNFFEAELERFTVSRDYPISIIMADIDGLKYVNDNQGHPAGDEMLRQAADVLSSAMRDCDILARIGGDEFSTLLPNTDANMVKSIVERIRTKIDEHNSKKPDLILNISIGSSTTQLFDLKETLKNADQSMYSDKLIHKTSAPKRIEQK